MWATPVGTRFARGVPRETDPPSPPSAGGAARPDLGRPQLGCRGRLTRSLWPGPRKRRCGVAATPGASSSGRRGGAALAGGHSPGPVVGPVVGGAPGWRRDLGVAQLREWLPLRWRTGYSGGGAVGGSRAQEDGGSAAPVGRASCGSVRGQARDRVASARSPSDRGRRRWWSRLRRHQRRCPMPVSTAPGEGQGKGVRLSSLRGSRWGPRTFGLWWCRRRSNIGPVLTLQGGWRRRGSHPTPGTAPPRSGRA